MVATIVSPLRRAAAGWKVGITTLPHQGITLPRIRVMPVGVLSSNLVEKFPIVMTTLGSTRRI